MSNLLALLAGIIAGKNLAAQRRSAPDSRIPDCTPITLEHGVPRQDAPESSASAQQPSKPNASAPAPGND